MRNFFVSIALGLSLFSATHVMALGAPSTQSVQARKHSEVVDAYLKIQDALTRDSWDEARKAADELSSKVTGAKSLNAAQRKQLEQKVTDFKSSKDLEAGRKVFKDLSEEVITLANAGDKAGLQIYECPMYKARWIQAEGKMRNPYYGTAMLECGVKREK